MVTSDGITVKLIDFNTAKVSCGDASTFCGSLATMSEEVKRMKLVQKRDRRSYDPLAADIASSGKLLMLFLGIDTTHHCNLEHHHMSKVCKDLLYKILDSDPLTRPKIDTVLKHSFIASSVEEYQAYLIELKDRAREEVKMQKETEHSDLVLGVILGN